MVRLEMLSEAEFDRISAEHETPKRTKLKDPEAETAPRLSEHNKHRSIATIGVKWKGKVHTPAIIETSDVEAD